MYFLEPTQANAALLAAELRDPHYAEYHICACISYRISELTFDEREQTSHTPLRWISSMDWHKRMSTSS